MAAAAVNKYPLASQQQRARERRIVNCEKQQDGK